MANHQSEGEHSGDSEQIVLIQKMTQQGIDLCKGAKRKEVVQEQSALEFTESVHIQELDSVRVEEDSVAKEETQLQKSVWLEIQKVFRVELLETLVLLPHD